MKWASKCILNNIEFENAPNDYLLALCVSAVKSEEITLDKASKYFPITQKIVDNWNKNVIRSGQRWTKEETQFIITSLKNNRSCSQIADSLDRSTRSIICQIQHIIDKSGKSHDDACKELNINPLFFEKKEINETTVDDIPIKNIHNNKKITMKADSVLLMEINRKLDLIVQILKIENNDIDDII